MIPLLIGIFCSGVLLLIYHGAHRSWRRTRRQPSATVVVCARNEEELLLDCLLSLGTQDYPSHLYQLVLVDHLSSDKTGEIMDYFAEQTDIPTKVIHIREQHPRLRGKVHALATGLDAVETEVALVTDADCVVGETWVSSLLSYLRRDVVGVGGLVTVGREGQPRTLLSRLQQVDNRYLHGMLAGLSGLYATGGDSRFVDSLPAFLRKIIRRLRPSFVQGNNMAFRMKHYREVGGYEAIGPSMIEDYALMKRMVKHTGLLNACVLDSRARVWTHPLNKLKDIWHQKRRWGTSVYVPDTIATLLFLGVFLIRIVLPWLLLLYPIQALLSLLMIAIVDILIVKQVTKRVGDYVSIKDMLVQELFLIVENHLFVLAFLFRWPVFWKGERHGRHYQG